MAGPALSTAKSGNIYVGSEIRNSLSLLDVLYSNQFEGNVIDPEVVEQTEENFYRGAPPKWLNFHISEQAELDDIGTPFIKRDGYDTLVEQIHKKTKFPGVQTVKLFHQPGCGGTTLAMKVLWDLKKTFRSAVLTGSTSDISNVAEEVVHLFTAGPRGQQNTVLLLVNGEQILENLQESIMMKVAEKKIVTRIPVVILLNCIREDAVLPSDQVVLLKVLSDTEKKQFDEKKEELSRRYGDKYKQFHGFNIMQTHFSQDYIQEACSVFKTIKRANRPKKTQLAAFLSLLNAYVPGSYLLESQCLDFFNHDDYSHKDFSLEDRMEPFSHLMITFQQDGSEKKVCMAHSMIAQCCTELMDEAGVTRSDTTRNLLTSLCRDEVPLFLVGFVKDMLTKRKPKPQQTEKEENPINRTERKEERFSRLILDIQKTEGEKQSTSVLELATNTFDENPFFPQALSRFYCIELKNYHQAEKWAKEAKLRDPLNSFVADTLGQVHKNHLKNIERPATPREILQLATNAIQAFKDEERLAENECGMDMKKDGTNHVSPVFNTRGLFGYLQVCSLVYNLLVSQNETWRKVLTKDVSLGSVLGVLEDNKLSRFNNLIDSLRDEVERKCAFFDKYLTYSKPDMKKDDPSYLSRETSGCYRQYVGDSPPKHCKGKGADLIQKLKQNLAYTSAGVLSCLDRDRTESELNDITACWEAIFLHKYSVTALANYILAHIMLRNMEATFLSDCKHLTAFKQKRALIPEDSPELQMLTLLLCWPADSEDKCVLDLNKSIQHMHCSYEHAHKKHFGSRYLRPLFFIGKGQDLDRIVHRKVLEEMFLEQNEETTHGWSNEKIFKDPRVQARLLKVEGEVRNYRVFATISGTAIEVDANVWNSLWRRRQVSFYLGFTIRGPVAFDIQTKTAEKVEISETDTSKQGLSGGLKFGACCGDIDSKDVTKVNPEVNTVDEVQTYSLQSQAGKYECSVSALRWVCKEAVSFTYKFLSWEEHTRSPLCIDYIPAGPLLDITVTAGEMEEVHLPHRICVDQDSTVSDMFAVLHVGTCGVVMEQVSEVTSSHVKFHQPTSSPKGVMIRKKAGVPFYYDVLIYKTNKEFLTLDVYLVPRDSAQQQEVEKKENSFGSVIILKPGPDKSMQMGDNFSLTTDKRDAKIQTSTRELRYDSRSLFEVFIRNADGDFNLRLESGQNTVWTCTIHEGDYQSQSPDHKQAFRGSPSDGSQ